MAATMGGTMRAPLTAMVFAAGADRRRRLIVPRSPPASPAYAFTVLILKRSILTEKVARRGLHVIREYSIDPLDITRVGDVMVQAVETLPADMTIGKLVDFFGDEGRHRAYPVVDPQGRPVAMAYRADALHAMRDADKMDVTLGQALGGRDMPTADLDEPMNVLVTRMIQTDTSRISCGPGR